MISVSNLLGPVAQIGRHWLSDTFELPVNFVFWYTRRNHAGMWRGAELLQLIRDAVVAIASLTEEPSSDSWFTILIVLAGCSHLPFALKTLLRLCCSQRLPGKFSFSVSRRSPTRKERRSKELETELKFQYLLALTTIIFGLENWLQMDTFHVLGPVGCYARAASSASPSRMVDIIQTLSTSMLLSTNIGIVLYNFRAKTFGNTFKLVAYIGFVLSFLDVIAPFSQSLRGQFFSSPTVSLSGIVNFTLATMFALQATMYPGVPQTQDHDE